MIYLGVTNALVRVIRCHGVAGVCLSYQRSIPIAQRTRSPRNNSRGRYQDRTRVNEQIRAREVRVIGGDGEQLGIMAVPDALRLSDEQNLDLVEVAPNADPPVCRMMDYGKYLYEKQKREREARKSQKQVEIKELRLRPKTDTHDVDVVVRKIQKFMKEDAKVRVRVRFRGREIVHQEVARDMLQGIANNVSEVAEIETRPKMEGRSMIMVLSPA